MVVEDFIDELYAFDNSNWADSLESILNMLNFPAHINYVCDWKEFLYVRSEKRRFLDRTDKKTLADCQGIAMFALEGRYQRFKLIAVNLTGNRHFRNENACDIYKLFRKLYGKYIFFLACFDREIAFVGTAIDKWDKSEVIISDWFGENTDHDILSRIMEIDFSLFSHDNLGKLFGDYLWAIARPYIKYPESKMYLIYEYGQEDVSRDETLRINAAYYPDMYGDDYYIDDPSKEDDSMDILDEDEIEFEWTMLEMNLAEELIEYNEEDDYEDEDEVGDYEDNTAVLTGLNPEEMLKWINREASPKVEINTRNTTSGNKNALATALQYLDGAGLSYSYNGLIKELESDGFTPSEARFGADKCGANWKEQAVAAALSYLEYDAYSYKRLIKELESDGFTLPEARFGADKCGANWKKKAVAAALSYLEYDAYSYKGLIKELVSDGFTLPEARFGADNCGADWKEQAVAAALSNLKYATYSYYGMIEELESDGFTSFEAQYGVDNCGVDWNE